MDEKHLITVFETTNPAQAEIIQSFLRGEGIETYGADTHQGGYVGVLNIQLKVDQNDAERAKELIANPPQISSNHSE